MATPITFETSLADIISSVPSVSNLNVSEDEDPDDIENKAELEKLANTCEIIDIKSLEVDLLDYRKRQIESERLVVALRKKLQIFKINLKKQDDEYKNQIEIREKKIIKYKNRNTKQNRDNKIADLQKRCQLLSQEKLDLKEQRDRQQKQVDDLLLHQEELKEQADQELRQREVLNSEIENLKENLAQLQAEVMVRAKKEEEAVSKLNTNKELLQEVQAHLKEQLTDEQANRLFFREQLDTAKSRMETLAKMQTKLKEQLQSTSEESTNTD